MKKIFISMLFCMILLLLGITSCTLASGSLTGSNSGGTTSTPSGSTILVSSIVVDGSSDICINNGQDTYTTSISPTTATNKNVTWSVIAGTGSATINSTSGALTAAKNGSVTVRAAANDGSGVTGSKTVNITNQTIDVTVDSITIQGQGGVNTITYPATTLQMVATVLPINAEVKDVTWEITSGYANATINTTTGLITAIQDGTIDVVARDTDGVSPLVTSNTYRITISSFPKPGNIRVSVTEDVTADIDGSHQVYIGVYPDSTFQQTFVTGSSISSPTGKALISLQPGTYYVYAFFDTNGNASGPLYAPDGGDILDIYSTGSNRALAFIEAAPIVVISDATTDISLDFHSSEVCPNNPGKIKVNYSFTGSGTVNSSNPVMMGISTDPYVQTTTVGTDITVSSATIYFTAGSGNNYLGGFYDRNGNFTSTYSPDGGDSVGLYDNKGFNDGGDPITVTANNTSTITFTLSDTYKITPKFVYVFSQSPGNDDGTIYKNSVAYNGYLFNGTSYAISNSIAVDTSQGATLKPMAFADYDRSERTPKGLVLYLENNRSTGMLGMDRSTDIFTINKSTGALTHLSGYPALITKHCWNPDLNFATQISISGAGPFNINFDMYAADINTGSISTTITSSLSGTGWAMGGDLKNNFSTLALTSQFSTRKVFSDGSIGSEVISSFASGNTPSQYIIYSSDGLYAYAKDLSDDHKVYAYSVNTSTGALTSLNNLTATNSVSDLTYYSGINALYINENSGSNRIYRAPLTSGSLPASDSTITGISAGEYFKLTPNSKFAYKQNGINLYGYTVNSTTGNFTQIGGSYLLSSVGSFYIDLEGKFLFITGDTSGRINVYTINQADGTLTDTGFYKTLDFNPSKSILSMNGSNN